MLAKPVAKTRLSGGIRFRYNNRSALDVEDGELRDFYGGEEKKIPIRAKLIVLVVALIIGGLSVLYVWVTESIIDAIIKSLWPF